MTRITYNTDGEALYHYLVLGTKEDTKDAHNGVKQVNNDTTMLLMNTYKKLYGNKKKNSKHKNRGRKWTQGK